MLTIGNQKKDKNNRLWTAVAVMAAMTAVSFSPASFATTSHVKPDHDAVRIVAKSDTMDWNGVVVTQGRIFVSGPRWAGFPGPAVGIINDEGDVIPFPDKTWNGWKTGMDGAHYFVCVNAIHLGPDGALWVVDPGAPVFGQPVIPNGPKLVKIDPKTGDVQQVLLLGPDVIHPNSYINDIRFNPTNNLAYLTDTGSEGVVVFNTSTGQAWRVLEGHPSTLASLSRPIIADGKRLEDRPGHPAVVPIDPLEVSPDGKWLYYGPVAGPWSKVPTALIDDPSTPAKKLLLLCGLGPICLRLAARAWIKKAISIIPA